MAITSWLCTNSSKSMFVKIVHPGGHAELHDRPVLAAEIMLRNPRCVVAHPHVFQKPWAIVSPDIMLMLGQKYYVVPVSTIRKLQRLSFKYSPSNVEGEDEEEEDDSTNSCMKHTGHHSNKGSDDARRSDNVSKDNCFMCLLKRIKIVKGNITGEESREGLTRSSSSASVSSDTKVLVRRRINDFTKGSPKRAATLDHWQPRLESITEEQSN